MDYSEFIQFIADMRQAQRDYFAVRCSSNLNMAKELEREVDRLIKEYKTGKQPEQGRLW